MVQQCIARSCLLVTRRFKVAVRLIYDTPVDTFDSETLLGATQRLPYAHVRGAEC